jgi:hypothetical protein
VTFADSGYIPGVINPPAKQKHCYGEISALPLQWLAVRRANPRTMTLLALKSTGCSGVWVMPYTL